MMSQSSVIKQTHAFNVLNEYFPPTAPIIDLTTHFVGWKNSNHTHTHARTLTPTRTHTHTGQKPVAEREMKWKKSAARTKTPRKGQKPAEDTHTHTHTHKQTHVHTALFFYIYIGIRQILIFIGVDGAEGEVLGGGHARLGQHVEEGGLANVREAHDTALEVRAHSTDDHGLHLSFVVFLLRWHRDVLFTLIHEKKPMIYLYVYMCLCVYVKTAVRSGSGSGNS